MTQYEELRTELNRRPNRHVLPVPKTDTLPPPKVVLKAYNTGTYYLVRQVP